MRVSVTLSGIVAAALYLTVAKATSLPTVDLGYGVYQATLNVRSYL
jgi:hypothetical protein